MLRFYHVFSQSIEVLHLEALRGKKKSHFFDKICHWLDEKISKILKDREYS